MHVLKVQFSSIGGLQSTLWQQNSARLSNIKENNLQAISILEMQQYEQKPYCILLFEILQYIAALQYLASYWLREGVYTVRKVHPMKCKTGSLGDLGHNQQKISLDCAGNFS